MNKREKAIDRARKLMAMAADSSSPNEAAIAARRARAIMDQYQLSAGDLREQSEFGTHTAGKSRQKVPVWEQGLGIYIAKLNDCMVKFNDDGQFVFEGFDEDAQLAEFMFTYLVAHGLKMSRLHMKATPGGNPYDFKMGYWAAIKEKIVAIIEERASLTVVETGQALMVVKQSLVAQEFGNVKYGSCSTRSTRSHYSREAGHATGCSTNIVTGVSAKTQGRLS